MGNNHDKFFSKNKRKVLVLGLQSSGKTTFVQTLKLGQPYDGQTKQSDLEIYDIKVRKFILCIFDLGGAERQRIFWRQNFFGTQGIIFVIDATESEKIDQSLLELEKILIDPELNSQVPIAVFMNKGSLQNEQTAVNLVKVNKSIVNMKLKIEQEKQTCKKVCQFEGSSKNYSSVLDSVNWLLKEMQPI